MGANLIERILFIAGKPHLRLVSKELTEIRREKKIEKKIFCKAIYRANHAPVALDKVFTNDRTT